MATIYRRGGSKNRRGPWIAAFVDHLGKRVVRSTRTSDENAAWQVACKYESDAALRRAGILDPRDERFAEHAKRPIAEHVDDFDAMQADKKNDEQYRKENVNRIRRVIALCEAKYLTDLDAAAVQGILKSMHDAGTSLATCNSYLVS